GLLGVLPGLEKVLLGDRLRGAQPRGALGRLARQPRVGVGAHVIGLGGLHLGALERDERLIGRDAVAHLDEELDDAPRDRGGQTRGALLVELDRAAQVGEARGLDLGDGRELEERELRRGEARLGGGRRLDRLLAPAGRQHRQREHDDPAKPHGDTSSAAARVTSKAAVFTSRSAARCSRSVCTQVRSASRNSSSDTAPSRNDTSAAWRASPAWRRKAPSKRSTRSRAILKLATAERTSCGIARRSFSTSRRAMSASASARSTSPWFRLKTGSGTETLVPTWSARSPDTWNSLCVYWTPRVGFGQRSARARRSAASA